MSKTNEFHEYNPGWTLEQWKSIAAEGQYTRIDSLNELPEGGKFPDSLTGKLNAVTVVCSGCANSVSFIAQTYRADPHDKSGFAIDQQTLVACFDKESGSYYGGFVQHGGWKNYTTYPPGIAQIMSVSGVSANVHFKGKPLEKHGSIEDLKTQDIIEGIETPLSVLDARKRQEGKGPI